MTKVEILNKLISILEKKPENEMNFVTVVDCLKEIISYLSENKIDVSGCFTIKDCLKKISVLIENNEKEIPGETIVECLNEIIKLLDNTQEPRYITIAEALNGLSLTLDNSIEIKNEMVITEALISLVEIIKKKSENSEEHVCTPILDESKSVCEDYETTCSICGKPMTIAATHNTIFLGERDGQKVYKCRDCGTLFYEPLEEHICSPILDNSKSPCEDYETVCEKCGKSMTIAATHNYTSMGIVDGVEHFMCTLCYDSFTRPVHTCDPALNESKSPCESYETVCKICGKTMTVEATHNYQNMGVENGENVFMCLDCGDTYRVPIEQENNEKEGENI